MIVQSDVRQESLATNDHHAMTSREPVIARYKTGEKPMRTQLLFVVLLVVPLHSHGQIAEYSDSDTIASAAPRTSTEPGDRDFTAAVEQIVSQTQEFRQQHDLGNVEINPQLTQTAEYFAQYMAETGEYGHVADGRRPSERAKAHDYAYCLISENIGYIYSSEEMRDDDIASRFVQGWKDSPEHRENMLQQAVTEIGVAVAQSAESGYFFAVQMFGRPESAAIRFEITNQSEHTVIYRTGGREFELPPRYTRTHKRCRTGEITFIGDESAQQPEQTLEPRPDEKLMIVSSDAGGWEIERQESEQTSAGDLQSGDPQGDPQTGP
jgi:uncharacterized protein YkwD